MRRRWKIAYNFLTVEDRRDVNLELYYEFMDILQSVTHFPSAASSDPDPLLGHLYRPISKIDFRECLRNSKR